MRYCEITCDVQSSPDCREYAGPQRTMEALVKDAVFHGWKIGPASAEVDACPECRNLNAEPQND